VPLSSYWRVNTIFHWVHHDSFSIEHFSASAQFNSVDVSTFVQSTTSSTSLREIWLDLAELHNFPLIFTVLSQSAMPSFLRDSSSNYLGFLRQTNQIIRLEPKQSTQVARTRRGWMPQSTEHKSTKIASFNCRWRLRS
jgi:hypothetical protein